MGGPWHGWTDSLEKHDGLSTWPAGACNLTPHSPFCLSQIHLYNTLRSNVLPIHLNTENAILGYNRNFCTLLYIHHLLWLQWMNLIGWNFCKKALYCENKINGPAFSRTPQCSICANSDAGSSAHWTFGDNASCRCLLQHTHRFELYCSSTYRSHCHPDCRDRWRKQQGIAGMLYIYKSFRNRAVTIVFHR